MIDYFFFLLLKDFTWNDTWVLYHVIAYFIMLVRCGSVLFGHGGKVQILRTASLTRTIFGCERIFQMFLHNAHLEEFWSKCKQTDT